MKLINRSARLQIIGGARILPGDTAEIADALAARVRACPAVKSGELEVMPDAGAPSHASLADMSPVKAKALIAAETSIATLGAWLDAEDRKDIIAAIESRAKALSA